MPLPSGDQHNPSFPPLHACRLQAYASEYDDDVKDLQRRDLTPQQRLAAQVGSPLGGAYQTARHACCAAPMRLQRPCGCTAWLRVLHAGRCAPDLMLCSPPSLSQLRLGEKRILRGTMDGVRRRLAPIRGIPTKVRCGRTAGLLLVDCCSPGEHWCLVRLRLLLLGALHPAAALDAVQCSSAAHTWGGSTCLHHSARPRSACLPC